MRKWKLDISSKNYQHITCFIVASEPNLAMRRAAKEIANARAHLGDLGWFLYGLAELEQEKTSPKKQEEK